MIQHWSDDFSQIASFIIGPTAILLNILLLVIMTKNTPKNLQTYAIIIKLGAFIDILIAIANVLIACREMVTGNAIIIAYRGLCGLFFHNDREFQTNFCAFFYISQIHMMIYSQFILVFSYYYRYRIIATPFNKFQKKQIYSLCIGSFIFLFIFTCWVHYNTVYPIQEIEDFVRKIDPDLVASGDAYSSLIDLSKPAIVPTHIMTCTFTWVVITVAYFSRHMTLKVLSRISVTKSSAAMHRALVNILVIQTSIPIATSFAVGYYILCIFFPFLETPASQNLLLFPTTVTPILSPAITFTLIQPYRAAIMKMFSFSSSNKRQVTHIAPKPISASID